MESKERMTMNKQFSQRFLDLALNNKYGVIPSRADLPAWWKLIPPEIPFPRNPKLPARIAFLKTYIGQSDTKRWAATSGKDCLDCCANTWIMRKTHLRC